jgi:hypothetical protein
VLLAHALWQSPPSERNRSGERGDVAVSIKLFTTDTPCAEQEMDLLVPYLVSALAEDNDPAGPAAANLRESLRQITGQDFAGYDWSTARDYWNWYQQHR